MGKSGTGLFREWNECKFIFHSACRLNSEQIRRLIGNDIIIIVFIEDSSFDLSSLDEFGAVPQVFAIVQPVYHQSRVFYRFGFVSRNTIKPFGPNLFGEKHFFLHQGIFFF